MTVKSVAIYEEIVAIEEQMLQYRCALMGSDIRNILKPVDFYGTLAEGFAILTHGGR